MGKNTFPESKLRYKATLLGRGLYKREGKVGLMQWKWILKVRKWKRESLDRQVSRHHLGEAKAIGCHVTDKEEE
jgi:hypothetical protein